MVRGTVELRDAFGAQFGDGLLKSSFLRVPQKLSLIAYAFSVASRCRTHPLFPGS